MNLSEFAFRIVFLFIPGLIAFKVFEKLTFHREYKSSDTLFGSLIFGFLSYLLYGLAFVGLPNLLGVKPTKIFYFPKILLDPASTPNFREIIIVTLVSFPVGLIFTALANQRLLYRVANSLKLSKVVDNLDVWTKVFNSPVSEWVVIRDLSNDLMYEGIIEYYSDGQVRNEIMLRDVSVLRNSTSEPLYKMPKVYLNLGGENFVIEFRTWMQELPLREVQAKVIDDSQEN